MLYFGGGRFSSADFLSKIMIFEMKNFARIKYQIESNIADEELIAEPEEGYESEAEIRLPAYYENLIEKY